MTLAATKFRVSNKIINAISGAGGGDEPAINIPPGNLYTYVPWWYVYNGFDNGDPFNVTWQLGDTSFRLDWENSLNCGGTNSNTQGGSFYLRIPPLVYNLEISLSISGVGEAQNEVYERLSAGVIQNYGTDIEFSTEIAYAHSPGGLLGCAMGAIVVDSNIPYILPAYESVVVQVGMTTGDPLYHTNAYYNVGFNFAYA